MTYDVKAAAQHPPSQPTPQNTKAASQNHPSQPTTRNTKAAAQCPTYQTTTRNTKAAEQCPPSPTTALMEAMKVIKALQERLGEINEGNKELNAIVTQSAMETKQAGVRKLMNGKNVKPSESVKTKSKSKAVGQSTRKRTEPKKQTQKSVPVALSVEIVESNSSSDDDPVVEADCSFESGETETEIEKEDNEDDSSVGSNVMPSIHRIINGFMNKVGNCTIRIAYDDNPKKIFEDSAAGLVEDDVTGEVLHWIMEKKKSSEKWREQITERINKLKGQDGVFKNWVGWEEYVKEGVEKGILSRNCLSILDDGGGKATARVTTTVVIAESPLQLKRPHCSVHSFKEEGNPKTTTKDKGYILSGVVCEGYGDTLCGMEFVAKISEAIDPNKASIVRQTNPAYWCEVCHLVYCKRCYLKYVNNSTSKGNRKRACLNYST